MEAKMKGHIRELLSALITALVIAPITGHIGYKLNDYLSRDKISIERVYLIPETTKLPYPAHAISELSQHPNFRLYLSSRGILSFENIIRSSSSPFEQTKFLDKENMNETIATLLDFSEWNNNLSKQDEHMIS
jgi:hypothetical protein